MAYLFSRLNDLVGQNQGRRATDVLQGGPAQQDRESLAGQAPGIASQPSAIIGAQAQAQPNPAGEAPTAVNSESRAKVFQKNQDGINAGVIGNVTSGISRAQQNLQNEANKYAQANVYQAFDQGIANRAVDTNDVDAFKATGAFLNAAPEKAKDFGFTDESLQGLRDSTLALQSREGLTNQIAQQSGLNRGESRLDAQFLERTGEAGRQRAAAARAFADLQARNEAEQAKAKQLVESSSKARESDVSAIKNLLSSRVSNIQDAASQRRNVAAQQAATDAEFARQRERAALASILDEYRNSLNERAKESKVGIDFARQKLASFQESPNLDRFLTVNTPELTDSMFLSDADVAQANRANALLGVGNRFSADSVAKSNIALQRERVRKELDALLAGDLRSNDEDARYQRTKGQGAKVAIEASKGNAGVAGGTVKRDSLDPKERLKEMANKVAAEVKNAAKPKNVATAPVKQAKAVAKGVQSATKAAAKTVTNTAQKLDPRKWRK